MAYRLKRNRSVAKELRRIVLEEVDTAVGELKKPGTVSDTSIHEARKSIKKIRGAIRLMRDELGPSFSEENRSLGDVGRGLSELRDATVLVSSLTSLIPKTQNRQTQECLKKLAGEFRRRQQEMVMNDHTVLTVSAAVQQLSSFVQRVDNWPCAKRGFNGLRTGCKRTLKRTRKAFKVVQQNRTPEHLHDWRKRVKDHWYHVRLLADLWPDVMSSYEGTLNDLETKLGDHHNLQVLKERVENLKDSGCHGASRTAVLQLISNEQNRLREEAEKLGEILYSVKAKDELRNIEQLWTSWRNG